MYIYIKQTYIPVEVFCGNYLNETKLTYGFLFTTKTYLFILRIYIYTFWATQVCRLLDKGGDKMKPQNYLPLQLSIMLFFYYTIVHVLLYISLGYLLYNFKAKSQAILILSIIWTSKRFDAGGNPLCRHIWKRGWRCVAM